MRSYLKIMMLSSLAMSLSACTSHWDMQGMDPKEFYAQHPIKNSLMPQDATFTAHFLPGQNKLGSEEVEGLDHMLSDISASAVESVQLQMSDADLHNDMRKNFLLHLLRSRGYEASKLHFMPSAVLARDDVEIDVAYVTVVSPDCPDWRLSPVTTYSNTSQGNFGCATETNLGLMVADPHDLVRGSGSNSFETERDAKTMMDYRSGKDFAPIKPASSDEGSAAKTSSSSSAGQ